MSSLPPRVMHDEGPFAAAVHHHGSHGSHASQPDHHAQAAVNVTDSFVPCPYEAKVVANGTTARMVLMFLRELVEQPHYPQFGQTYRCPMMKCYEKFEQPFLLVQHLLSCPELPNGEFDCDKCQNWHEFPTNEKDWSLWQGWSGKLLHRHNSHAHGSVDSSIQRKRSFSSKMRETFTLRKKDSRKPNSSLENHPFSSSSRPSTAASGASSILTMSRCPEHEPMVFSGHNTGPNFVDLQKPIVSSVAPQIENSIFWPRLDTDTDLQSAMSTVSSLAPSSFLETATTDGASTTNTSRTTLFDPGLAYQSPTTDVMTPPFLFSPHSGFDNSATPLGHHQSSSAMSIDEPMPVSDAAISPSDTATPSDSRTWWSAKPDIDTPRPTPVASPFYPMGQAMVQQHSHTLSRPMSQESMQDPMPGVFSRAHSEGTQMDPLSPHADHVHHNHQGGSSMTGRCSPTEDLVCDECQWKPRGVRENLRGYLRKHKNTHKGLRLPCDVVGCTKTFSRLDNLKKHKKDKHGIDEPASVLPLKRVAEEDFEHIEEDTPDNKRPSGLSEADIRSVSGDYSMLWPALHF